ncbi:carbonic anhydrase 1-like [Epargyreus clarus]|uniref:carbonic anhydrase 1-like n=1 Tax=Epargyreus clarus TaxID=520877 RepID=UPI003C3020F1
MHIPAGAQTEEEEAPPKEEAKDIPPFGTLEWIQYLSESEGALPTPIDVSITDSLRYYCPELKWYNFDIYPHKIKMTNTGYTLLIGAKWRTERPYLEGGPFLEKHVFSQIHFHWGADMMEGSEHTVDKRRYPGEMQVTFFRSEYMTQEEALRHPDGVVMICYIIKYGVNPDDRLSWVIEGFPRVREAQTHTRIGPYPLSRLLPMFYEDYFLYWGSLTNVAGESFVVRWLVPRITLFASFEQMKEFRKLWDPWDEPNLRNYRQLKDREDRHVLFICPHWNQYNSLLPIPRVPEPSLSVLSPAYQAHPWMLPAQNAYMQPSAEENTEEHKEEEQKAD